MSNGNRFVFSAHVGIANMTNVCSLLHFGKAEKYNFGMVVLDRPVGFYEENHKRAVIIGSVT